MLRLDGVDNGAVGSVEEVSPEGVAVIRREPHRCLRQKPSDQ